MKTLFDYIGHIEFQITNDKKDFYISYNNYDVDIYGSDTTALVKNDMSDFFILNGDHTKQYDEIIQSNGDFETCFNYFKVNINLMNSFSDKLDVKIIVNSDGSLSKVKR